MQCQATSKQSGARCRRHATPGRLVCHYHGGAAPVGPAAPNWRHGRHSRYLPLDLRAAFQATLADPNRLALDAEIALVDARLGQLLAGLEANGAARWPEAAAAMRAYDAAQAAADRAGMHAAVATLRDVISRGAAACEAWRELHVAINQRRRLVDSERRRLETAQSTMTAEQAMTFVGALAASVKAHVTDRKALAAISADIERVLRNPAASAPRNGR
jgi:hypothetical protein